VGKHVGNQGPGGKLFVDIISGGMHITPLTRMVNSRLSRYTYDKFVPHHPTTTVPPNFSSGNRLAIGDIDLCLSIALLCLL
jgi:hypothetical protein